MADTERLVAWRSNPLIIRYFRNPHPITRVDHERWYETLYLQDPGRFDFMVIEKRVQEAIGTVGIRQIEMGECSCEISYMIAEPAYQRKGYAVEAITAMMRAAMQEGICRFFAEIHVKNVASRRTVEKVGYVCQKEQSPFAVYFKRENLHASDTC